MKISFALVSKPNNEQVYSSHKLLDVFKFIRREINIPQNYFVLELEDEEECDFVNANYLIHNFTEDTLPITLTQIL